jgi:hypothetical protein
VTALARLDPARPVVDVIVRARVFVAVGAATALVVGGCATPRAALGTSLSPCYQALPLASDAVAHQGRLAGVRRVTAPAVARLPRTLGALPAAIGPAKTAVVPGTIPVGPAATTAGLGAAAGSGATAGGSATSASGPGTSALGSAPTAAGSGATALAGAQPTVAVGPAQAAVPTTLAEGRSLCLVAFQGNFDAGRIPLLRGTDRSGRYAVVVVAVRTRTAGAVFLTDQLPRSFKKR